MKFLLILLLSAFVLSSCIWPDPYHMQIYKPIGKNLHNGRVIHSLGGDRLAISIQSSGKYVDQGFPPYRVAITLYTGHENITSVVINSVSVLWNDRRIEGISLRDVYTSNEIPKPGKILNINPAPCCRFRVISNWLPIEHTPGDKVSITVSVSLSTGQQTFSRDVSANFEAVEKKGLFQVDGFVY